MDKHKRRSAKETPTHNIKLSKALSYVLRHGAVQQGLSIDSHGFIRVQELLSHPRFRGYSEQDVRDVVSNNDKQRFALGNDSCGELMIRANQGHSIEVQDLALTEFDYEEIPWAIHGTYKKNIHLIQQDGLSRMSRQHIHMSVNLPDSANVISGMRHDCDYLVRVNIWKAAQDGLKFFKSANDVILCPGDENGYIPPKYLIIKAR